MRNFILTRLFRRTRPQVEAVKLKEKRWKYVHIQLTFSEETERCVKKATWTVPTGKRINGW